MDRLVDVFRLLLSPATAFLGLFLLAQQAVAQPDRARAPRAVQAAERSDSGQSFHIIKNSDGAIVLDGIKPVLVYQRATKSMDGRWPRAHYIHPLYDLDGEVLTEDFPSDHGHHRGVFWAWHQVWVGNRLAGDAWVCQDFNWDVQQLESTIERQRAVLRATVAWSSPGITNDQGQELPLVEEQSAIIVHPVRTTDDLQEFRCIDFEISIRALVDGLKLGGSDDEKGYGGFSPRVKLNESTTFHGQAGEVEPQVNSVAAGSWIDISDGSKAVAILCHPSNPGFPQPWILRRAESMQNAAYPGRHPVALPKEQPLVLKYRLVIHRGKLNAAAIDGIFAEYSQD